MVPTCRNQEPEQELSERATGRSGTLGHEQCFERRRSSPRVRVVKYLASYVITYTEMRLGTGRKDKANRKPKVVLLLLILRLGGIRI